MLVICALNLCENVFREKTHYRKYKETFGISYDQLLQGFKDLCIVIEKSTHEDNISSLKRKYESARNHGVGKLKLEFR